MIETTYSPANSAAHVPTQTAPTSFSPQEKKHAPSRTIYDASGFEIFFKNFLAGFGRAVGNVFVYLLFLLLMAWMVARFVWPTIKPYVQLYQDSLKSLQTVQTTLSGNGLTGGLSNIGTLFAPADAGTTGSAAPIQTTPSQPQQGFSLNGLPQYYQQQLNDLLDQSQDATQQSTQEVR